MKHQFVRSMFLSMAVLTTSSFANVGGKVFVDMPDQVYGMKEANEAGLADFKVKVTDVEGHSQTVKTDSNGVWSSNLSAPVRVEFKNCDDCYNPTQFDIDSKGSVVLVNEDRDNIDFGVYKKGSYKNSATGDEEPIEVGNLVWEDDNGNGLQDPGEKGISGVAVELYCDGELVDTAQTDENGYYLFSTDISKSNTDSLKYGLGDYLQENNANNCKIVIGQQTALANLDPTDSFKGDNPLLDSNGVPVGDGVEIKIPNTLKAGKYDYSLDAGFKPRNVCIGDYVWNDTNGNGIQDSDEKGAKGILVKLLNEDNDVVATYTTDKNGKYEFCELFNGEKYRVKVQLPNESYEFSPKNQGGDKTKDSDVDENGMSDLITIGKDDNFAIDAGIHSKLMFGNHCVWIDKGINTLYNLTKNSKLNVDLCDIKGRVLDSIKIDNNLPHKFCGLKNGKYFIKFKLPKTINFDKCNLSQYIHSKLPNCYVFMKPFKIKGSDVKNIGCKLFTYCKNNFKHNVTIPKFKLKFKTWCNMKNNMMKHSPCCCAAHCCNHIHKECHHMKNCATSIVKKEKKVVQKHSFFSLW